MSNKATDKNKLVADRESILLALDQLRQTMEVMGQVVERLHRSVDQAQTHHSLEERALQEKTLETKTRKTRGRRREDDATQSNGTETPIVLH